MKCLFILLILFTVQNIIEAKVVVNKKESATEGQNVGGERSVEKSTDAERLLGKKFEKMIEAVNDSVVEENYEKLIRIVQLATEMIENGRVNKRKLEEFDNVLGLTDEFKLSEKDLEDSFKVKPGTKSLGDLFNFQLKDFGGMNRLRGGGACMTKFMQNTTQPTTISCLRYQINWIVSTTYSHVRLPTGSFQRDFMNLTV